MSKLDIITNALNTHPEVRVVNVAETPFHVKEGITTAHDVRIVIACRQGIYDIPALNALLRRLVPEIRPDDASSFFMNGESMSIGNLMFREEIGSMSVKMDIVITDPGVALGPEFTDRRRAQSNTTELVRVVRVSLYPNEALAAKRLSFLTESIIPQTELAAYRPRPPRPSFVERWLQGRFAGFGPWMRL